MHALGTCVLYLIIGAVIAAVVVVRTHRRGQEIRWWLVVGLVPFWPLLLPLMGDDKRTDAEARSASRILSAERRLVAAQASLNPVVGDAVADEIMRARVLVRGLGAMQSRIAEMDTLLASPDFDRAAAERTIDSLRVRGVPETDGRFVSAQGRLTNIERLQAMRATTAEDIERVLLLVDQLCAQLQLLKFAGTSAGSSETLQAIRNAANSMQELAEALLANDAVAVG